MLDLSPDLAPPQAVRLADYRVPEFLVDTVDLVFDLDGANTRVKAWLGIRLFYGRYDARLVPGQGSQPWRSSAFLFSEAIRPSIPLLRRMAENSDRRVASSLIAPDRYTSRICQAVSLSWST